MTAQDQEAIDGLRMTLDRWQDMELVVLSFLDAAERGDSSNEALRYAFVETRAALTLALSLLDKDA